MAARALSGSELPPLERPWRQALAMLWRDKFALLAALYLLLMVPLLWAAVALVVLALVARRAA